MATAEPDEVYARIYAAVLEKLAGIFSVNRARIRLVLARLQHERIVDLIPNRGAFVAHPSIEDSNDVLEARRVIEPAVLRRLVATADKSDIAQLTDHVARERRAHRDRQDAEAIRLSGEFHNLVAELAGNSALANATRGLSALTCLAILVHHPPTASACRPADHAEITQLVKNRDAEGAATAALAHLDRVQDSLVLSAPGTAPDLVAVFATT
jgi:DNA-binding GntR family transcriptional regulator